MNLPEIVKRLTYRVQGADCQIWVGRYHNKIKDAPRRFCYITGPTGTVDVRHLLFGDPSLQGFKFVTPTCGNGRCLTPDHQVCWGPRIEGGAA